MVTESDKSIITELAKQYRANKILLFGSSLHSPETAKDIDIGVEGISPSLFFRFYGELLCRISLPVDVVDLSKDSKFTRLIREEGVPIYG